MSHESELLRRFVAERSEDAFAALVERYSALVYSAALRQLGNDREAAADVSQAVFIDFARKASRLQEHESLTGWFYRSTRYAAINHRRAAVRRQIRELEAHRMSEQPHGIDWAELGPVLDEAMHELNQGERELLLLRFFDGLKLGEMGKRFGISENATRMRVERALDKLRLILESRGLKSSIGGLAALLGANAVVAAPKGVTEGLMHLFPVLPQPTLSGVAGFKMAIGVAMLVLMGVLFWQGSPTDSDPGLAGVNIEADGRKSEAEPRNGAYNSSGTVDQNAAVEGTGTIEPGPGTLKILAVEEKSLEPVPSVQFEMRWMIGQESKGRTSTGAESGESLLPYPTNAAMVEIFSIKNGFADKRLRWRPERGEKIPEEYQLKLQRAVWIGGTVTDPEKRPLAGATVGLGLSESAEESLLVEIQTLRWTEAKTDSRGKWSVERAGEEELKRLSAVAKHDEHASVRLEAEEYPQAAELLKEGKHVFQLGAATVITGFIRDTSGVGIANAKVAVETLGSLERRETVSGENGSFLLSGVIPGRSVLSAMGSGYAPNTKAIVVEENQGPHVLQLSKGKRIAFRVLDPEGRPIEGATVGYCTHHTDTSGNSTPAFQPGFWIHFETDTEGRAVWNDAPEGFLCFSVTAPGWLEANHQSGEVWPSETVVTMTRTLTIRGTVKDAITQQSIPEFRIIAGWARKTEGRDIVSPHWSTIDRHWMRFVGGKFQHDFTEPPIHGVPDPSYIFRFEADGYEPFITNPIDAAERVVEMEIELRRARVAQVQVITPEAKPAGGAEVTFYPSLFAVNISNPSIAPVSRSTIQDLKIPHDGSIRMTADGSGTFEFRSNPEFQAAVMIHESGYLVVDPEELLKTERVELVGWTRLMGRVTRNGKGVEGKEVMAIRADNNDPATIVRFQTALTVSDPEGYFMMEGLPAGEIRVVILERADGRPRHLFPQMVTLGSGETGAVGIEIGMDGAD